MRIRDLALRPMCVLPLVLVASVGSMRDRCWAAPVAADTHPVTITMEADRPLWSFARQFRERHGISVTYEEAAGTASEGAAAGFGGDGAAGSGAGASGRAAALDAIWLSVTYQVSTKSGQPRNPAAVIQDALAAYTAAGATVHFKLLRDGAFYHIVPAEMLSAEGTWVKVTPILGTRVDLARGTRTVAAAVLQILAKVKQATGAKIEWVDGPVNWASSTNVEVGGHPQETARELIDEVLAGTPWTWALLYSTLLKTYGLRVDLGKASHLATGP